MSRDGRIPAFTQIGTSAANVAACTDSPGSGRWVYRVRAFNAGTGRFSAYSNQVAIRVK